MSHTDKEYSSSAYLQIISYAHKLASENDGRCGELVITVEKAIKK